MWAVGQELFSEREKREEKQGEKQEGKLKGKLFSSSSLGPAFEQEEKQAEKEVSHGDTELLTKVAEKQASVEEMKEVFLKGWNAERERRLQDSEWNWEVFQNSDY